MSQQLELLTENSSQWTTVSFVTPEIQKKEIKPFVLLALKELEGNPDSRTKNLMNADKFSAVRSVVRHVSRLRSANKEPWVKEDVHMFLEGLKFSPECADELTSLLCTDKIYENVQKHLRIKPGIESLEWKIDVSLRPLQALMKRLVARFQKVGLMEKNRQDTPWTLFSIMSKQHTTRERKSRAKQGNNMPRHTDYININFDKWSEIYVQIEFKQI